MTVDIPEAVYEALGEQAARASVPVDSLIVEAVERCYPPRRAKGEDTQVIGPMVRGKGKLAPRFPVDETPHDLIIG